MSLLIIPYKFNIFLVLCSLFLITKNIYICGILSSSHWVLKIDIQNFNSIISESSIKWRAGALTWKATDRRTMIRGSGSRVERLLSICVSRILEERNPLALTWSDGQILNICSFCIFAEILNTGLGLCSDQKTNMPSFASRPIFKSTTCILLQKRNFLSIYATF